MNFQHLNLSLQYCLGSYGIVQSNIKN